MRIFINAQGNRNVVQIVEGAIFSLEMEEDRIVLYVDERNERYRVLDLPLLGTSIRNKDDDNEIFRLMENELVMDIKKAINEACERKRSSGYHYIIDIQNFKSYNTDESIWCLNMDWSVTVKEMEFTERE